MIVDQMYDNYDFDNKTPRVLSSEECSDSE